jgi:hypothetical protein
MMIKSAVNFARVVVLNACYSDGLADQLCTTVDCVVGMAGAVHDVRSERAGHRVMPPSCGSSRSDFASR